MYQKKFQYVHAQLYNYRVFSKSICWSQTIHAATAACWSIFTQEQKKKINKKEKTKIKLRIVCAIYSQIKIKN